MHIRRPDQQCAQRPPGPVACLLRDRLQRHQQRERPDLADQARNEALVRFLGDPSPPEELDDEKHVGGDGEEVGLKGIEADGFKLEGEVLRHRVIRDEPGESEEVDGPHVVVGEAVPELAGGEGFTVVHVAFGGVVADNAVDHDVFFARVEPAVFSAEETFCLGRRGGEVDERDQADESCEEAFEGKEPSPTSEAVVASKMEDAECEEGGYDACGFVGNPEEAETHWELLARVEVAQVQNIVRDEPTFNHPEQSSTRKEGWSAAQERLHAGDETPGYHLDRDPAVRTQLFGNELRGELCKEKADVEDCLSSVVVVGVHVQIVEHVIREGLRDVAPVELEGEEHQAYPGADPDIELEH